MPPANNTPATRGRGAPPPRHDHRATVRGLGLKWTNHTVELEDTPSVRGMVTKVNYLVKVVGE